MVYNGNGTILNNQRFQMNFNGHWASKFIIGLDEGFLDVDKKAEREKLKQMVTANEMFLELKGVDVKTIPYYGHLIICSNDAESYPDDSFDNMKLFAAAHDFPFPYLHDADQTIARAYDAVCTPDFFGFDAELGLQYRGRLDASRKETGPAELKRDLFEAMRQVAETGHGPEEQIASMGCSIKWRETA